MNPSDNEIQASLAPPGAGIPLLHRLLGRFLLKPFVLRRASWSQAERRFQRAHEEFKHELKLLSSEQLTKRVLVPPQKGLEDSSRFWSAAMCARHLTIVGREVEEMIVQISSGQVIDRVADTGAVKPELEKNDVSVIEEYAAFGDTLMERLSKSVQDRNSKTTFNHPWFGAMTAKEWVALYSVHTNVHLEQLRAIRAGLS